MVHEDQVPSCIICIVKTRTEFIIWIELGDPVTDGDTERLVETAKEYVKFAQGRPDINAYKTEDCLCILVAATSEGPYRNDQDGRYIRDSIRRALTEAGMLE